MRLALLTVFAASLLPGQSTGPQNVLQRYLSAGHGASAAGQEQSVEVEIDAALPRLQKEGSMRGLKVITRAGQTVYTGLRFTGDRLIKKDVISRYLAADIQRQSGIQEAAIAPGNYRFEFAREVDYNGRVAQVFRLIPKHKRPGLFRGELWLDRATALPLREWGDIVKSPSRFLGHPRFVRDYSLVEDRSRPRRLILTARAALVGDVQLTVWFGNETSQDGSDEKICDLDLITTSNP